MDNSYEKFVDIGRGVSTPSEHRRGILEQGTEPLNPKIGPCGELTSHPWVCLAQLKAAVTGSGLSHPHQNDPSYFRLRSPFLNQGHGVGVGWGGVKISPSCDKRWDCTLHQPLVLHKTDSIRTITGGLACAYHDRSKSHIDT